MLVIKSTLLDINIVRTIFVKRKYAFIYRVSENMCVRVRAGGWAGRGAARPAAGGLGGRQRAGGARALRAPHAGRRAAGARAARARARRAAARAAPRRAARARRPGAQVTRPATADVVSQRAQNCCERVT